MHDAVFRRSSPGGGTSWTSDDYVTVFDEAIRDVKPGAKSAVYDCLVQKASFSSGNLGKAK